MVCCLLVVVSSLAIAVCGLLFDGCCCWCAVSAVYCMLVVVCWLLFVVRWLLFVVCCLLVAVGCQWLCAVCRLIRGVLCLSIDGCCLLFPVCCWLRVVRRSSFVVVACCSLLGAVRCYLSLVDWLLIGVV